jgi:carbonic anhydrase/acetyltransferase-like protein (isoleucine patch superfamily)
MGATPLAPFDRPAPQLPFLDLALSAHQERAASACNLEMIDVDIGEDLPTGTVAAIAADLLLTPEALARALNVSQAASTDAALVQMGVRPGSALFDATFAPRPDDADVNAPHRLPFWLGKLGGMDSANLVQEGAAAVQSHLELLGDDDEERVRVDPHGAPPHHLRIPRGLALAGRVNHWLSVLNLNLALLHRQRQVSALNGGRNQIRGKFTKHPTAFVSGSIIEDGVTLEADCSVINSYLGRGVQIADHAIVEGSVIGEGCHTLVDTHVRRIVAFSGSTLANLGLADCVLGREVFITTGVQFHGLLPNTDARVGPLNAARPVLGGAVGDGAIVGARALIQVGTAIPSGAVVVMRPHEGLSRIDDEGLARANMVWGSEADRC